MTLDVGGVQVGFLQQRRDVAGLETRRNGALFKAGVEEVSEKWR